MVPDLLDWTRLKLVNVSLQLRRRRTPPKTDEFLFRSTDTPSPDVDRAGEGRGRRVVHVTVTYFLLDGTRRTVGPERTSPSESVFLELPA